jgi:hypothetical protein
MYTMLLSNFISYKHKRIMFITKYDQGRLLSSKDIKVPAVVSSLSTSSRRTVFTCRANVEQREVSEVPIRKLSFILKAH